MSADLNSEKKQKILGILRITIALLALSAIIFICFKQKDDLADLFYSLSLQAFFAGVGLFLLANVVISLRWYLLLLSQDIKVPFTAALKVHFLGLFYNNIMPSSVGGDMLRVWYIAKYTRKRLEAGFSVIVDRIIGLFTLVLMALTFYFLFPVELDTEQFKVGVRTRVGPDSFTIAVVLGIMVLLAVLVFIIPASRRLIVKVFNKGMSHRGRVLNAIILYCKKPFVLVICIILTFISQSLPIIGFWLMGESMGIEAPAKYYFVFFPISWVAGALPISIGGIGVIEGGLAGLFGTLTLVTRTQGLALALCQRFVFIIASLPGVCIHLTGAHLPSDTEQIFIDSDAD